MTAWCYESHSVVSSKRSEPSHTTHAWLFQCKSMHRETGGASVDHTDRVVTCCCSSSSLYGGTEVDRVLVVSYGCYFVLDAMLDRQPVERATWAHVVDESTKYNNVSQFARWRTSQLSLTVLAVIWVTSEDVVNTSSCHHHTITASSC